MSVVEAEVVDVREGGGLRRAKLEIEEDPAIKLDVSTERSSIGQPDDDDVSDDDVSGDDDDEVQSTLSSLASLEDSLPIKRGLSKFYGGKSKSFGNLGEVRSMEELGKTENPFNKRRRTIMAYNLMLKNDKTKDEKRMNENNKRINTTIKHKSGLFYTHANHISMPLLPLAEDDDDDNVVDDSSDDNYASSSFLGSHDFQQFKEKSFASVNHTTVNAATSSRLDIYSSVN